MLRAADVMGFAGGFTCGVQQAGFDIVAKREPSAFGGFGVGALEKNMRIPSVEVTEPEFWSIVRADMVFGNPPCSGFSMLSTINTADSKTGKMVNGVRVAQRGMDSPDNKWMGDFVSYSAKVKPAVAVFECVQSGGKLGAPLMRELRTRLRQESGLDYQFTDVFMNAALVGGDVIRPRYFWVAHLGPFGVDLPRERPRPLMDLIRDLPFKAPTRRETSYDVDRGHVTNGSSSDVRIRATIELFRTEGYDWEQGQRLPKHLTHWVEDLGHEYPDWWYDKNDHLLSHAVSDNMYSPFRWRAGKPMGVVTGGFLDRAVHPLAARPFTYREGARFMGLPDDWSLAPYVIGKKDQWLGKGIPVASGRWLAGWARGSIEGEPGAYRGREVEPGYRVINVTNEAMVRAIDKDSADDEWWDRGTRPTYSTPRLYDRAPQREQVFVNASSLALTDGQVVEFDTTRLWGTTKTVTVAVPPGETRLLEAKKTMDELSITARRVTRRGPRPPSAPRVSRLGRPPGAIARITPEDLLALIAQLGLNRHEVAEAIGCSPSRVTELTTHARPNSWLNAERWDEVQAALRAYADSRNVRAPSVATPA